MRFHVKEVVDDASVGLATLMPVPASGELPATGLQQRVCHQTTQLSVLRQFSHTVRDESDCDTLLSDALGHAMTLVPAAHYGAIYLMDEANKSLVLHASYGFNPDPAGTLPLTNTGSRILGSHHWYVANSADELALLLALDVNAHQTLLDAFALDEIPSGFAIVPLVAQSRILGMLFLVRQFGRGRFVDAMDDGLATLAYMAAAAVQHMQPVHASTDPPPASAGLVAPPHAGTPESASAAMLHAARLAAVGQMTAALTHEINNPLWSVQSALDLAKTMLPDDPRFAQLMQIARDELRRVMTITRRMRDFYRPHREELVVCNLHHLLKETLALAEIQLRHTKIMVTFIPAAEQPIVTANDQLLRQVFLNLILNAIDAMPDGGTLTVRVMTRETTVLVDVQDTGVGIPPDIRPHLFEPFMTSKPTGTGLGLSISAQIIAQHAGTIALEDSTDQGCTFRVVLPYYQADTQDSSGDINSDASLDSGGSHGACRETDFTCR